jgi:ubiquinone/menaquinone biosynthesis C-methylase UbiE
LKKKYKTEIEFTQLDINNLYSIKDESIDIIGSDAVFEHLRHFKQSLQEVYRIMKQDSILYATYGPLWYSWGGDHISGVKGLKNGYQHLLLDKRDYEESLDDLGKFLHSENDGRTWIKNDLFSYLKPKEYLVQLEEVGFRLNYSSAIIDPRAIEFKKRFPHKYKILRKDCNFSDLAISGMTILCTK